MRHLLPLLLLGLSGCHFPAALASIDDLTAGRYGEPSYGSDYVRSGVSPSYGRLEAAVWFDPYDGVLSFDLSRPAHVAVFALHPTGDVQLLYPAAGTSGREYFGSGTHAVRAYMSGPRQVRSTYGGSNATYIVMIAADRALRTSRFMTVGGRAWLSRLAGGWSPFSVTEALAREIVPYPNDTEWTVAYQTLWSDGGTYYRNGWNAGYGAVGWGDGWTRRWVRVACPDGTVLTVPEDEVRRGDFVCPRRGYVAPGRNAGQDTTRPAVPRVTETLPRRPRPQGWTAPAGRPLQPGSTGGTVQERPLREESSPATESGIRRVLPSTTTGRSGGSTARPARPPQSTARPIRTPQSTARPTSPASSPPRATPRATPPTTRPAQPVARPVMRSGGGTSTTPTTRPRPTTARPRPASPSRIRPAARPASSGTARPQSRPKPKPAGGGGGS